MTSLRSNPFPSDTVVKDSIDDLPDFRATETYRKAVGMVENLIEEFPLTSSPGLAMGIRGRFGSGKTHLMFQLISEVVTAKGAHCKPIYAKTDKVDFLDVYINYFARKFEAADLKKVVSLHLARLLKVKSRPWPDDSSSQVPMSSAGTFESVQDQDTKTLAQIAQEEVDQLVRTDPQSVLTLVENDLLPVSGLNRDFDRDIETTERKQPFASDGETSRGLADAASNVSLDFFRAYSKLTDPHLSSLAVRWIQGSPLSNSERVDLGLESAAITQPSVAKEAMRFLLAAFKKADFTVVFCLDEFERFSSRGAPADVNACAGLLKDLAEIFKKTGHLLVVSGIEDAWQAMPPDVFARIELRNIVQMILSEAEAKGLADAYCRSSGTSVDSLFEANAFHLVYEASNHNPRRVLDLAHKAYELAAAADTDATNLSPVRIQELHVERAANYVLSAAKRQDAVGRTIQNIASAERLPLQVQFRLDGLTCDYLLGDQQNPRIAVKVTQSIFKLGEVSAAREIANLSQLIRHKFPRTAFCVVIVGYSTQEVRNDLIRVVDRVFSFDEDKFETEFREFLQSASLSSNEVDDRLKNQESAYQDLLEKFDELESRRRNEIDELKTAFETLQSESLRARETTREKRVTDKMTETLDELEELLDEEEQFAFPSSSRLRERRFPDAEHKLNHVTRLLDEQHTHISRARILNQRLPRAQEFLDILKEFDSLTAKASEIWYQSSPLLYGGKQELPLDRSDRHVYRRRKELLTELQSLHSIRKPGILEWLRQNKTIVAVSLLSVIGVTAVLYSLYRGWSKETEAIDYYTSQLATIQGKTRLAQLELRGPKFSDPIYSLLNDIMRVEATPYNQTYIVVGLASRRLAGIREDIVELTASVRSAPTDKNGTLFGETLSRATDQLASIGNRCATLQEEIGGISFSRFALRFLFHHSFFIPLCIVPLSLLILLLLRRRRLQRYQR